MQEARMNSPISELHFSVRAKNCLDHAGIHTIRDLVTRTEDELMEIRNFGDTTLTEIREKLRDAGLRLGMKVPPTSLVS
jgi:DNA-directed RNA polymerase subunit alpha